MPLIPRRRRERTPAMTVVEHLDELRRRLVISALAVLLASLVGLVFAQWILDFLIEPYQEALRQLPEDVRPPGSLGEGLVFSGPAGGFVAILKVGFVSGFLLALFAFMVLPTGLSFLLGFGGQNLVPLITTDRYLSFLIFLILGFGLSFELPLILIFLAGVRIITSRQLRKWRRYAALGTAVFAAVATPTQDPYTMSIMWAALYVLYEVAILVTRLMKR
jgi:sec-independent protein translocase protein TatC